MNILQNEKMRNVIRAIAMMLIISFIAYDISWAYPDRLNNRPSQDKLAPQSLFKDASRESIDSVYAALIYGEIEKVAERSGIPLQNLRLEAVKTVLRRFEKEEWFQKYVGYAEDEGEIRISFSPGNILRYYYTMNGSLQVQYLKTKARPGPSEGSRGNMPRDAHRMDRDYVDASSIAAYLNRLFYNITDYKMHFQTTVTDNSLTAEANAREFYNYLITIKDRLPDEIVIHEWGIGDGQFAIDFLKAFVKMDEEAGTFYRNKLVYMIGDFSEDYLAKVEGRAEVAELKGQIKRIEFHIIDAAKPLPFRSNSSLLIRFNELYTDLPDSQVVVKGRGGRYYHLKARLKIRDDYDRNILATRKGEPVSLDDFRKNYWLEGDLHKLCDEYSRGIIDASEYARRADELEDRRIDLLKKLDARILEIFELEYQEPDGGDVIDLDSHPAGRFIQRWAKSLPVGSRFSINLGALRNLAESQRILDKSRGGYLQFFDYGFNDKDFISKEGAKLGYRLYGGQPTLDLNFQLLQVFANEGGFQARIRPQSQYISEQLAEEVMNSDVLTAKGDDIHTMQPMYFTLENMISHMRYRKEIKRLAKEFEKENKRAVDIDLYVQFANELMRRGYLKPETPLTLLEYPKPGWRLLDYLEATLRSSFMLVLQDICFKRHGFFKIRQLEDISLFIDFNFTEGGKRAVIDAIRNTDFKEGLHEFTMKVKPASSDGHITRKYLLRFLRSLLPKVTGVLPSTWGIARWLGLGRYITALGFAPILEEFLVAVPIIFLGTKMWWAYAIFGIMHIFLHVGNRGSIYGHPLPAPTVIRTIGGSTLGLIYALTGGQMSLAYLLGFLVSSIAIHSVINLFVLSTEINWRLATIGQPTFPPNASLELIKKLILETRDECGRLGGCKAYSFELTRRLIKEGMNVYIAVDEFNSNSHLWVETEDGYVLDAFPEGMGGDRVAAAKKLGDERFIIVKKDSDIAQRLYQGKRDEGLTSQAKSDAANDIGPHERMVKNIYRQFRKEIIGPEPKGRLTIFAGLSERLRRLLNRRGGFLDFGGIVPGRRLREILNNDSADYEEKLNGVLDAVKSSGDIINILAGVLSKNPNLDSKLAAAIGLARLEGEGRSRLLGIIHHNEDPDAKITAARALATSKDGIRALYGMVSTDSIREVKVAAAEGLASLPERNGIKALTDILRDPKADREGKEIAQEALEKVSKKPLSEKVYESLRKTGSWDEAFKAAIKEIRFISGHERLLTILKETLNRLSDYIEIYSEYVENNSAEAKELLRSEVERLSAGLTREESKVITMLFGLEWEDEDEASGGSSSEMKPGSPDTAPAPASAGTQRPDATQIERYPFKGFSIKANSLNSFAIAKSPQLLPEGGAFQCNYLFAYDPTSKVGAAAHLDFTENAKVADGESIIKQIVEAIEDMEEKLAEAGAAKGSLQYIVLRRSFSERDEVELLGRSARDVNSESGLNHSLIISSLSRLNRNFKRLITPYGYRVTFYLSNGRIIDDELNGILDEFDKTSDGHEVTTAPEEGLASSPFRSGPRRRSDGEESKWEIFDRFVNKLNTLTDEVIKEAEEAQDIGAKRKILIEAGIAETKDVDASYLVHAISKSYEKRSLNEKEPIKKSIAWTDLLSFGGIGRYLICYKDENPEDGLVVKMPSTEQSFRYADLYSLNGAKVAMKRLGGGLAADCAIIDARRSGKPFVFHTMERGRTESEIAIVQRKILPLVEYLKGIGRRGCTEEELERACAYVDKLRALIIAMYKRGVVDTDIFNIAGNYGIRKINDSMVVFDLGELSESERSAHDFVKDLDSYNELMHESLLEIDGVLLDERIAEHFKANQFKREDFIQGGVDLFGSEYNPEGSKMKFPYTEEELRALFAGQQLHGRDPQAPFGISQHVTEIDLEDARKPTRQESEYLSTIARVKEGRTAAGDKVIFMVAPNISSDAMIRYKDGQFIIYVRDEELRDILDNRAMKEDRIKFEYFSIPHELDHVPTRASGDIVSEINALSRTLRRLYALDDRTFQEVCIGNHHIRSILINLNIDIDSSRVRDDLGNALSESRSLARDIAVMLSASDIRMKREIDSKGGIDAVVAGVQFEHRLKSFEKATENAYREIMHDIKLGGKVMDQRLRDWCVYVSQGFIVRPTERDFEKERLWVLFEFDERIKDKISGQDPRGSSSTFVIFRGIDFKEAPPTRIVISDACYDNDEIKKFVKELRDLGIIGPETKVIRASDFKGAKRDLYYHTTWHTNDLNFLMSKLYEIVKTRGLFAPHESSLRNVLIQETLDREGLEFSILPNDTKRMMVHYVANMVAMKLRLQKKPLPIHQKKMGSLTTEEKKYAERLSGLLHERLKDYAEIIANALVWYTKESLESLAERGILTEEEASSIIAREPFDPARLANNIVSILDAYRKAGISEASQRRLLAHLFTIEEMESLKSLFPGMPRWLIHYACAYYPTTPETFLRNIMKARNEIREELNNISNAIIFFVCAHYSNAAAFLRQAIELKDEIKEEEEFKDISDAIVFDACIRYPRDPRAFLRSHRSKHRQLIRREMPTFTDVGINTKDLPSGDVLNRHERRIVGDAIEYAMEGLLSERAKIILLSQYGISDTQMSKPELRKTFNISTAMISYIVKAAIKKLQHPSRKKRLTEYLESHGLGRIAERFYEQTEDVSREVGVDAVLSDIERLLEEQKLRHPDIYLKQLELLNALGILTEETRVFNFLSGFDLFPGLYASKMWTVDDRLDKEDLPAVEETVRSFILKSESHRFKICTITHERLDAYREPGFLKRWASMMREGDVVFLKYTLDYLDNRVSKEGAINWHNQLAEAIPEGVLVVVIESRRSGLASHLLGTGLFEDQTDKLLSPEQNERLKQINDNIGRAHSALNLRGEEYLLEFEGRLSVLKKVKRLQIKAPQSWWSEKSRGGLLCPLFSGRRRHDQGIGDLRWLDDFIDFLSKQNTDMLVLLPTTQTNPNDPCPYVSISLFANNAIGYLPLDELIPPQKLNDYVKEFTGSTLDSIRSANRIEYARVIPLKEYCLRREFEAVYPDLARGGNPEFNAYVENNKDWLEDYALFHSLLNHYGAKPWWEWNRKYKERDKEALEKYGRENQKEILFYKYLQWLYYSRWQKVRLHAREKGKFIIGDVPIYPAPNSADVWANQDIFDMTKNAGAPGEPIAPDGQNWGTHPYRWNEEYERVIKFWERRIRYMSQFYDSLRIDHLLGLCSEWLIDVGRHATTGRFYPASPEEAAARGAKTLRHLTKVAEAENMLLIGEDIGERDPVIRKMLDDLSLELPNLYLYNPVGWRQKHMANRPHVMVVEATHDTPATFGERYADFNDTDRGQVNDFLKAHGIQELSDTADGVEAQVLNAMKEEAFYCVTLQTLLKERNGQVNKPSTVGPHNWTWRSPEVEKLLEMGNLGYFPAVQRSATSRDDLIAELQRLKGEGITQVRIINDSPPESSPEDEDRPIDHAIYLAGTGDLYKAEDGSYHIIPLGGIYPDKKKTAAEGGYYKEEDLNDFLTDIDKFPLLTAKEERECAYRAEKGDKEARKRLINSNLRLVVSIAKKYRGRGIPVVDLVAYGITGLMRGIDRFKPSLGFRLSTYVTWWIRQAIRRAISEKSRLITIPEEWLPGLEDSRNIDVSESLIREEDRRRVNRWVSQIADQRKSMIIKMRFGLEGEGPMTLEETGKRMNLSRERIRQLENEALEEIRGIINRGIPPQDIELLGGMDLSDYIRTIQGLARDSASSQGILAIDGGPGQHGGIKALEAAKEGLSASSQRIIDEAIRKYAAQDSAKEFLKRFNPQEGSVTLAFRKRSPGFPRVQTVEKKFFRRTEIDDKAWQVILGNLNFIASRRKDLGGQCFHAWVALDKMFRRDLEIFDTGTNGIKIISGEEVTVYFDFDELSASNPVFTMQFLSNYLNKCLTRAVDEQEKELVKAARRALDKVSENTKAIRERDEAFIKRLREDTERNLILRPVVYIARVALLRNIAQGGKPLFSRDDIFATPDDAAKWNDFVKHVRQLIKDIYKSDIPTPTPERIERLLRRVLEVSHKPEADQSAFGRESGGINEDIRKFSIKHILEEHPDLTMSPEILLDYLEKYHRGILEVIPQEERLGYLKGLLKEPPTAAEAKPPAPAESTSQELLEKFIDEYGFTYGMVSDGSRHIPTPYPIIPIVFEEAQKRLGGLKGKHLLDFGAGDLRISIAAAYLYGMKVTAVEKDKEVSRKAEGILKEAMKQGFANSDNLRLMPETDALNLTWQDVDMAFFFYTEPGGEVEAKAFREKIEDKVKEMGPGGSLAVLFIDAQVAYKKDVFPGLNSIWPKPLKIYSATFDIIGHEEPETIIDYYLQIYQAPVQEQRQVPVGAAERKPANEAKPATPVEDGVAPKGPSPNTANTDGSTKVFINRTGKPTDIALREISSREGASQPSSIDAVLRTEGIDKLVEVRFADLDTGSGRFVSEFEKVLKGIAGNVSGVGVEPEAEWVRYPNVINEDIDTSGKTSLAESSQDIVTINNPIIQLMMRYSRLIGEAARILKPDGLLLLTIEEADEEKVGGSVLLKTELAAHGFKWKEFDYIPRGYPLSGTFASAQKFIIARKAAPGESAAREETPHKATGTDPSSFWGGQGSNLPNLMLQGHDIEYLIGVANRDIRTGIIDAKQLVHLLEDFAKTAKPKYAKTARAVVRAVTSKPGEVSQTEPSPTAPQTHKPRRNRKQWISYLKSLVAKLPKGTLPTPRNVAMVSDGELTPRDIRRALRRHNISYKEVGMVRERRSRAEWISYLKSLVAKLPKGTLPAPRNVAMVSDGELTPQDIWHALYYHNISYKEVGMIREIRSKTEWIAYLTSLVAKLPKDILATPANVASVSDGERTPQDIRSTLFYHNITYEEVGMVRERAKPGVIFTLSQLNAFAHLEDVGGMKRLVVGTIRFREPPDQVIAEETRNRVNKAIVLLPKKERQLALIILEALNDVESDSIDIKGISDLTGISEEDVGNVLSLLATKLSNEKNKDRPQLPDAGSVSQGAGSEESATSQERIPPDSDQLIALPANEDLMKMHDDFVKSGAVMKLREGGFKALLSENLFRPEDIAPLRVELSKFGVEILPPKEIRDIARNRNTQEGKLGCIVTKNDLITHWNGESHKNNNKAIILALDIEEAPESRDKDYAYVYIEGLLDLLTAMADKGDGRVERIKRCVDSLFDKDALDSNLLEKYLTDNDSMKFALSARLKLKPLEKLDAKGFDDYKKNAEKLLRSA